MPQDRHIKVVAILCKYDAVPLNGVCFGLNAVSSLAHVGNQRKDPQRMVIIAHSRPHDRMN